MLRLLIQVPPKDLLPSTTYSTATARISFYCRRTSIDDSHRNSHSPLLPSFELSRVSPCRQGQVALITHSFASGHSVVSPSPLLTPIPLPNARQNPRKNGEILKPKYHNDVTSQSRFIGARTCTTALDARLDGPSQSPFPSGTQKDSALWVATAVIGRLCPHVTGGLRAACYR